METKTCSQKIIKITKLAFLVIYIVTIFLSFFFNDNMTYDFEDENVNFEDSWEIINPDGSRTPTKATIEIEDDKVILVKTLPLVTDRNIITFEVKHRYAYATIDGHTIYKSEPGNLGPINTEVGNYNIMIHLKAEYSGQELKVEIAKRDTLSPVNIRNVFLSTRDVYALHTLTSNILTVIFVIIFFFISLISFIITIVIKTTKYEYKKQLLQTFFYLGCFTFSLAMWIIGNLSFVGILTGNLVLSGMVNYISFMALPISIIGLVKSLLKTSYKFIDFFEIGTVIGLISIFVLFYSNVMDLTKSLLLVQIIDVVDITALFVLFGMIIKKNQLKNNKFMALGFAIVGILCATGIVLYIFDYKWLNIVYIACFVSITTLFVVCLAKLFDATKEALKNREYYYFAYTDELTGLKNRKSYTEHLEKLENINATNDIIFVALDVNNLKGANDTYGHSAGDKLITSAANIIESTFENYGNCYRVGGDEFMVIMDKNINNIDELLEKLQTSAKNQKFDENIELSLAYGYSKMDLKSGDDINEYIKKADMEMYNNKKLYYSDKSRDRRKNK